MGRRKEIQRTLYAVVAADAVLVLLFAVISLNKPRVAVPLAPTCFLTLLASNFLFLRLKLKLIGPPDREEGTASRSGRFSLYACSAIFVIGTLYGVLMFSAGELPWTISPLLLVPLSLAIFCFRAARRARARRSN